MAPYPPAVSVVIPAYNAAAHLGECLDSVQAQEGKFTLEVIVVDDGSCDATAAVARRQGGVRLVSQPNSGPSAARNAGIAVAQGEFIAFLDADDLWPPGKLPSQLEALHRHPEAALVFGDCRQFGDSGPWPQTLFEASGLGTATWGTNGIVPGAYARLLVDNFITTGSVVARRSVLVDERGFAEDLRLVEDLDLWLRIARHHPMAWCSSVCLLRRRHAANISQDAEAMGMAYLNVLNRQRLAITPVAQACGRISLDRLMAHEYLHLADLALSRGFAAQACERASKAWSSESSLRALWLMGRSSFMLLKQRTIPHHRKR